MQVRTTKPTAGNKYYITKSAGGYSNAIVGSPKDPVCNTLANCVGYAYGRFNEIGGYGSCKYLAPVNAENFMQYVGSCKTGQTPKVGAVMVWQKGASLSGSDGAGHVAIVERVNSDTQVYTSESGYGSSKPFWNSTRNKGADGNWGAGTGYKFLGFIYNPAVPDAAAPAPSPAAPAPITETQGAIKKGDIVTLSANAVYYSGKPIPDWVKGQKRIVSDVSGDRAVIDKNAAGTNSICSPVNVKYLSTAGSADSTPTATAAPARKSVDELAREVIKGLWGNGADRKNRLSAAGYDYSAVQKRVNELL
jgi:surface antigen